MTEQHHITEEDQNFVAPDETDVGQGAENEMPSLEKALETFHHTFDIVQNERERPRSEGVEFTYQSEAFAKFAEELTRARIVAVEAYRHGSFEKKFEILDKLTSNLVLIDLLMGMNSSTKRLWATEVPVFMWLRHETGKLIAEIAQQIGDDLDKIEFYEIEPAIAVLAYGTKVTSGMDQAKVIEQLWRHWPIIKETIEHDVQSEEKNAFPGLSYNTVLSVLLESGTQEQVKEVKSTAFFCLQNGIEKKNELTAAIVQAAIPGELAASDLRMAPIKKFISDYVSGTGLEGQKMVELWNEANTQGGVPIVENFLAFRKLEKKQPGASAQLFKEFGIACFRRYLPDTLLRQLEERDRTDMPYGVVLYPRADHNGAFAGYKEGENIEGIAQDLAEKAVVRVFEVGNKYELMKTLLRLEKKYNAQGKGHKISFAILGGHGTRDSIQFGDGGDFFELLTEDLKSDAGGKSIRFFEKHPTIILKSCSTGRAGGIGQELSEALQAKIIAPDTPTSIAEIKTIIDGDDIDFEVTYDRAESKKVYEPRR